MTRRIITSKIGISIIVALIMIGVIGIVLIKRNKTRQFAHSTTSVLEVKDFDIVFGDANSRVTIALYYSYNCYYCLKFFKEVYPRLYEEFIKTGEVKVVLRLMLNSSNINIENALKTMVCVNKYGSYYHLHELLLHDYNVIFTNEFQNMIDEFLEKDIFFAECFLGEESMEYLLNNAKDFDKLKLRGTPTFIIGNTIYPGFRDYEFFKNKINEQL